LPILALTADVMGGMSERCRAAGMDGFLTKPIVRASLIAELERWLPVAFELRAEAFPQRRRPSAVRPSAGSTVRSADREPSAESTVRMPVAVLADVAPSIDLAEFTSRMGLEPGAEANDLLLAGWESMVGLGEALLRAVVARDRTALQGAAHEGKGAARSLGAMSLGDLCATLQAMSATVPWEQLVHKVDLIVEEHARVGREIPAMPTA
jgi:CheY-like chemotaxis protein